MDSVEEQKEVIKTMVLAWASKTSATPGENELATAIMGLVPAFGPSLEDADIAQLMDSIAKVFAIRMDMGVVIESKDHKPWVLDRKLSTDWVLWDAYTQYLLNAGRAPLVVDKLNSSLDVILDHLGDPNDMGSWDRRGLVIGDVQSGKTATYIGLMDKAVDVGYRIFIILTGNTESLRQQTQGRIDEGVLGQDSKPLSKSKIQVANKPAAIGVGLLANLKNSIASMTTMTTDFRKSGLEAINFRPGQDTLMVFVTKKNATVLRNIDDWLGRQVNIEGKIQVPLLFLDDEADFASVNTNSADNDPTSINKAIRGILNRFARSSYVGFTATPFANIFIDDEDEEDLFPRDFIYGLEAPTNYVGPEQVFGSGEYADDAQVIRIIDDAHYAFPLGHLNGHEVDVLPPSLRAAIRAFLIANAIRDLSDQTKAPRAMLVNVSRFNSVQAELGSLIEALLAEYRNSIRMHGRSFANGGVNADLTELRGTFEAEYGDKGRTWAEVLAQLPLSVAEIEVRVMNSKRDRKYEERQLKAENPPRTIAVGGDLLSRGLTLEGLMTSYFYRRVAASDTLMQMGRWFGYRDDYLTLTRLWITEELIADYASTADTLQDLRAELLRMKDQGLTPRQYGLAVKNHPSALLITARNKMRAATTGSKSISLRGRAIETFKVSSNAQDVSTNLNAASNLVDALQEKHSDAKLERGRAERVAWQRIPKSIVASFLKEYRSPTSLPLFSQETIANFVKDAAVEDLQEWDVVLFGGSGNVQPFGTINLRKARRILGAGEGSFVISGVKHRVAGPGDVATLLSADRRALAVEGFRRIEGNEEKNVPDRWFVPYLDRPLLLVYPIEGELAESESAPNPTPSTLIGVVLAIPERIGPDGFRAPAEDRTADVTYTLNVAAQRLWVPEIGADDEDE